MVSGFGNLLRHCLFVLSVARKSRSRARDAEGFGRGIEKGGARAGRMFNVGVEECAARREI